MDKQFIAERCVEALEESKEYMKMEENEEMDPDILQAKAEEVCYRKGFMDAMAIALGK
jgi:hypothetical protein